MDENQPSRFKRFLVSLTAALVRNLYNTATVAFGVVALFVILTVAFENQNRFTFEMFGRVLTIVMLGILLGFIFWLASRVMDWAARNK